MLCGHIMLPQSLFWPPTNPPLWSSRRHTSRRPSPVISFPKSIISPHIFPTFTVIVQFLSVMPPRRIYYPHSLFHPSIPLTIPPLTFPHSPSSSPNASTHSHSHPKIYPHNSACTSPPHSSAYPPRFYYPPRISSSKCRRGCERLPDESVSNPSKQT